MQDGEGSSFTADSPGDSYLLHPMTPVALCKLEYTLSRLQELLDMQNQCEGES